MGLSCRNLAEILPADPLSPAAGLPIKLMTITLSFQTHIQEFDLRVDIESLGVGPQGQEGVMPTELNYDAFRVLLS